MPEMDENDVTGRVIQSSNQSSLILEVTEEYGTELTADVVDG
jgi:hypothetical protein